MRFRMKNCLAVLLSVLAYSTIADAQITLDQCESMARKHYPEIAQYDLISQSEEFNVSSAARNWIPQINVSAQATWQNAVSTFPEQFATLTDMKGLAKDQYKVAFDINQTIWDGGASKAQTAQAKAEAQEQRLSSDVNFHSLESRVEDIYFGMLLLEENYKTCLSKMELLEKNEDKLESMLLNGLIMKSDLALVKVEKISLEKAIDQNRASYDSFRSMLEILIGESLSGRSLVRPEEIQTTSIVNNRPELGLIDAKIATMDAREDLLKVSLMPKFAAFAQGYYGNPGFDMFKSMMSRDWTFNALVGVRMQWNISSFFTYSSDRKKLDNARGMLTVQKDIFEYNTNLQSLQQNGEIMRIRKALEDDEQIISLRSGIRESAESQLANGVTDTATLLQRITEESEAINARNVDEINLLKTEYELKETLN